MRIALAVGCLLVACRPYDPPGPQDGTFTECCSGAGLCAPEALLESSEVAQLSRDSCGKALVCVPRGLTEGDSPKLASCTYAASGSEGRCAPACLPMIQEMVDRLARDDCEEAATLCVPCYNPLSGVATGICSFGADPGPSELPQTFEACCGRAGRCLPSSLVPESSRTRLGRDDCDDEALCTPVSWVRDPNQVPRSCDVSSTGAEGRCLSRCLPEVGERAGLSQDDCKPDEACVPCFDPISGDDTGACTIGDDRGPRRSPLVFASCCGDDGRCVPADLVTGEQRARLERGECEDEAAVCAPLLFLRDPEAVPASCTAHLNGGEGRCLPSCLPEVAKRADALSRDGCRSRERCVPCFDPLDGKSTGACELGGDPGPREPPRVFASCCENQGRCVPEPGLTDVQRQQLGRDVCEDESTLCAPLVLMGDPVECVVSATGGAGRCLPACLPEVARRQQSLAQDECPEHQLCTPCIDPITGDSTGACSSEREAEAPVTFEHCCADQGRCVPERALSDGQRAQLGSDTCSDTSTLCAPLSLLENPDAIPVSCRASAGGGEGRCLPSCLPLVASRGDVLRQDDCAELERCVPCIDPVTGEPTGACALGADPGPSEPPAVFDACCEGDGRCVPPDLIEPERRAAIGGADCRDNDALCVPLGFFERDSFVPQVCHDPLLGAEGRCLSACLDSVQSQLDRLRPADCQASERCVPCFDPIDGNATGACSLALADPGPQEPAVTFERCCGSGNAALGLCVPAELVPAGAPSLSRQTCHDTDRVCAPQTLVRDPHARVPACETSSGDGVCLPECLLSSQQQSLTSRASCAAAHACVPCSALPESASLCR